MKYFVSFLYLKSIHTLASVATLPFLFLPSFLSLWSKLLTLLHSQSLGPSECSRVKGKNWLLQEQLFFFTIPVDPLLEGLHYPRKQTEVKEAVSHCKRSPQCFRLVTVWLYTVMLEVCRWLTNEKQRKTDICLTDQ